MMRLTDMGDVQEAMLAAMDATRAADRERDAWVRTQLPRVERLLRRMLGPRPDLPDLVQSAVVEMLCAWPRFRGESAPSTFALGVAVQIARRALRPTAYQRLRAVFVDEHEAPHSDQEERTTESIRLARLRIALGKISADKRIAFCLWALEGLRVEEVAALVGASEAATRSRIHQAQKKLRELSLRDPVLRELFEERSP